MSELKGKLYHKGEVQQITDTFKKREFVIEKSEEVNGKIYNDHIKLQLVQDKVDLLDSANVGDELDIALNIRGRKWEKDGKVSFFNSLDAWRVNVVSQAETPPAPTQETKDVLPF